MAEKEQIIDQREALICVGPHPKTGEIEFYPLRPPTLLAFYSDGTHKMYDVIRQPNDQGETSQDGDAQFTEQATNIDIGFQFEDGQSLKVNVWAASLDSVSVQAITGTDFTATTPLRQYHGFVGDNSDEIEFRASQHLSLRVAVINSMNEGPFRITDS
jgi:hypothetical protein